MLDFNDVLEIQNNFIKEYMADPYDGYINMVGVSTVGIMENNDDNTVCLSVGFREQPPTHVKFPSEYQGIKIFYKMIGEIRPL